MPGSLRLKVKEITLDLSPSMKLIARKCFPSAMLVSDRFHVQRLINEAISDLRVDYCWQAIEQENTEIALAKEVGRKFIPHTFENGGGCRQLLARWYDKVESLGLKYFRMVVQTMQHNYGTIVNYFERRSTNASAESFNAKITCDSHDLI